MKKFKNVLLTAVVVLAGAVAAFITTAAKSANDAIVPGYFYNSSTQQCEEKRTDCSTTGSNYCTWTDDNERTHTLTMLEGTSCTKVLYERNSN